MLFQKLEKSKIKKILVVSLTNIGDTVLTCPVIDALIAYLPLAEISVVTGPKVKTLFEGNPYIKRTYIYTKNETAGQLLSLFAELRKQKFDAVIDLRHTALAYFLGAPVRTPLFFNKRNSIHKKDQHFERLQKVFSDIQYSRNRYAIFTDGASRKKAEDLIRQFLE
ncbi:MAG: glycosyltransferase family 9 protein, partial [Candidatus Omnitrophica bacterium]|nr:glycosyltransferase family 9 protein [Candidatus Omnitrophota bacterium]